MSHGLALLTAGVRLKGSSAPCQNLPTCLCRLLQPSMPAGNVAHTQHTCEQAIAYIRVCRPGSVIGPQQTFLHINEAELWKHGELYRQHQKVSSDATVPVASLAHPAICNVVKHTAAICLQLDESHVDQLRACAGFIQEVGVSFRRCGRDQPQSPQEKEAAAMRKAADAVAANALTRAVAKRSKASSGLVVDIVASATFDAVHTWPMDTEPPRVRLRMSAPAHPVRGPGSKLTEELPTGTSRMRRARSCSTRQASF